MASSKSVPRLLQPPRGPRPEGAGDPKEPAGGQSRQKGDRRRETETTHPDRDREVGDLEESEREGHGRSGQERGNSRSP